MNCFKCFSYILPMRSPKSGTSDCEVNSSNIKGAGVAVCAYPWKPETGGLRDEGQPGIHSKDSCQNNTRKQPAAVTMKSTSEVTMQRAKIKTTQSTSNSKQNKQKSGNCKNRR